MSNNHYQLKHTPEDFVVEEVLSFSYLHELQEKTKQNYHYLLLKKKDYNTFDAVRIIGNFFRLPIDSIGYAGLKDESAITSQHISIKGKLPKRVDEFNRLYNNQEKFISLKYLSNSNVPIQVGKLLGNNFIITIRNLSDSLLNNLSKNRFNHISINYYGSQRFGLPNQIKNSHLIGQAIINKQYKQALTGIAKHQSNEGVAAKRHIGSAKAFIEKLNPRICAFYQSAYHSHLWNQKIMAEIKMMELPMFFDSSLDIPLYWFSSTSSIFKLLTEDSTLKNMRITWENGVFKENVYDRPKTIQTQIHILGIEKDQYFNQKNILKVMFYLPLGTYATVCIHQFILSLQTTNASVVAIC